MSDELKSAWELALEKMEAGGLEAPQPLTDQQKEEIGELRRTYRSRVAEREITLNNEIRKAARAGSFDQVEALRNQLVEEKRALETECEERVKLVRQAAG